MPACAISVWGALHACAHMCVHVYESMCVSTCVRVPGCTARGWAHTQDGDLAEKFLVHPALPQCAALRGRDREAGVQRASHPNPSHVPQIP